MAIPALRAALAHSAHPSIFQITKTPSISPKIFQVAILSTVRGISSHATLSCRSGFKIRGEAVSFLTPITKIGIRSFASKVSRFHFQSQSELVKQLENHPLTKDPYLKEKKIIDAIAENFANSNPHLGGIDLEVMLVMYDLNETLDIPVSALKAICKRLSQALKDIGSKKTESVIHKSTLNLSDEAIR